MTSKHSSGSVISKLLLNRKDFHIWRKDHRVLFLYLSAFPIWKFCQGWFWRCATHAQDFCMLSRLITRPGQFSMSPVALGMLMDFWKVQLVSSVCTLKLSIMHGASGVLLGLYPSSSTSSTTLSSFSFFCNTKRSVVDSWDTRPSFAFNVFCGYMCRQGACPLLLGSYSLCFCFIFLAWLCQQYSWILFPSTHIKAWKRS